MICLNENNIHWGKADDLHWGKADDLHWGKADDRNWGKADDRNWGKADDHNCNYGHPKMADVESGKNLFCQLNCFYNVF